MIPVKLQPEPANFDSDVRRIGQAFLLTTPKPTTKEWEKHPYWRLAIPELRKAYCYTCAYSAVRIPKHTGEPTVDHFNSRFSTPNEAYEWSNFRLASKKFNTRKSTTHIVDPFNVKFGWFTLDFDTFLIVPNEDSKILPAEKYEIVKFTIKQLRLNIDNDLIDERIDFVKDYIEGHFSLDSLRKYAPFISYELERQNLLDSIKSKRI